MRVAVGGIYHETNTFVAAPTSRSDFEAYQFAAGDDLRAFQATGGEIAGFFAGCESLGWEAVPTLFAAAVPSGPVTDAALLSLSDELLERLSAVDRPDAVLLCLHGAMATPTLGDADGWLIRRVRESLDLDVPIVSTLDLHSNTSDTMAADTDALVSYDTYPHVDMYERGLEAVSVVAGIFSSGRRRVTVHRKVGLVTPPQAQYTHASPMQEVMAHVHELERNEDALISVTQGFPYADVACLGVSVAVSSAQRSTASHIASDVVAFVDSRREDFSFSALSVEEAVDRALHSEGPVVLVDSADNVGGGAPGDGTAILEEWLRKGGKGLVVAITDATSVHACASAGVGGRVSLEVGGTADERHGRPVPVDGIVRMISDGRFVHRGSYQPGLVVQMGLTAVVEVHGNTIVLTERRVMPFDAQQLLSLGISPRYFHALVVKSAIAWRAAYERYAHEIIEVDAPGVCTANLHRLGLSAIPSESIRPDLRRSAMTGPIQTP